MIPVSFYRILHYLSSWTGETLSSIIFPLRTNIKSFQKWGNDYNISPKIKQSIILFDEIILEAGTFETTISNEIALQGFEQWSKMNTRESALKKIEKIEKGPDEDYIIHYAGNTDHIRNKWRINKEDKFFADFRTLDLISEIDTGSYGNEINFIKYAIIHRKKNHIEELQKNFEKDFKIKNFIKTAQKIYGEMGLIQVLTNLYDSLALSQVFSSPVAVDGMHTLLLNLKTKYELGYEFAILNRLSEIFMPSFGDLNLDELLQLRKDKSIKSFRTWIQKMNNQLQSDHSLEIDKIIFLELLEEIKEMAPSKKEICIDLALGSLSFFPNPLLSLITTLSDVGKEVKQYDDFSKSWLSFILRSR